MVSRAARRLTACDLAWSNLQAAARGRSARLVRASAQALPFRSGVFDLVILLEAIYYLKEPVVMLREVRRVLREAGELVISTVNPGSRDFQPSPLSRRYFDSHELGELLATTGFAAELWGGFPVARDPVSHAISVLRRASWRFSVPWRPWMRHAIRHRIHGPPARFPTDLGAPSVALPMTKLAQRQRDTAHEVLYGIARKV